MLVYPVPHAVTQARVQLVADQTEKAPSHVIREDVMNVFAAKNAAERQALADFKEAQAKEVQPHEVTPAPDVKAPHDVKLHDVKAPEDHVDVKA